MEKLKSFWTDIFTAIGSEDSIAILTFLGVSFLLGLIFGAWSRGRKIRRLKRELKAKEEELATFKTQYDTLVEQFEKKEEELKNAETRIIDLSSDINRLTSERSHFQTELESAKVQLERYQAEGLEYPNGLGSDELVGEEVIINTAVDTTGFDGTGEPTNAIDMVQNDRLAMIEEKLEKLALENINLKQEISKIETDVASSGISTGGVVAAGTAIGGAVISSGSGGSTVTNVETGGEVLDLSETEIQDAPSTYAEEVLEEDGGPISPQERAERAKAQIGTALGSKIPRASLSEKDDLKKIEGIGPFIEMKLNDVGIFTYEQLSMIDEDVTNLITDAIQFFPGRIEKDDWKGQAASLMG